MRDCRLGSPSPAKIRVRNGEQIYNKYEKKISIGRTVKPEMRSTNLVSENIREHSTPLPYAHAIGADTGRHRVVASDADAEDDTEHACGK